MSVIVGKLNEYGTKALKLAEIVAKIQAVAGELIKEQKAVEGELETLKAEIKDKAKYIPDSQAHTLRGSSYQLVWKNGSSTWDTAKVAALIEKYNAATGENVQAADLKTTGEGGWQLRENGKGGK